MEVEKSKVPEEWHPDVADFLKKLLIKNPALRLGRYGSYEGITSPTQSRTTLGSESSTWLMLKALGWLLTKLRPHRADLITSCRRGTQARGLARNASAVTSFRNYLKNISFSGGKASARRCRKKGKNASRPLKGHQSTSTIAK